MAKHPMILWNVPIRNTDFVFAVALLKEIMSPFLFPAPLFQILLGLCLNPGKKTWLPHG